MTEKIVSSDHVEIEAVTVEDEPANKTARSMMSLLEIYAEDAVVTYEGLNLNALRIKTDVSYNADSQRFEVGFSEKPPEIVRKTLKAMNFGWNKFESCWELYAWQARLFDSVELAYFLEGFKRGMSIKSLDAPIGAKRVWWKDLDKDAKGLIEELAEAVQAERSSEAFGELLKIAKLRHRYSWNNSFLIYMQCPHYSLVLSEKKWNKIGRHVKWGERPILILAPMTRKVKERDPNTGEVEEKRRLFGFISVPVFDHSQTEGKPLPELKMPDMSGDDGAQFLEAMKDFCKEHKIEATFKDLSHLGYDGVSRSMEIEVNNTNSINQQVSTIVHEVAHEYMKHGENIRDHFKIPEAMRETVAEGTAHVVLKQLGLPSKAAQYLAVYDVTKKDIKSWIGQIAKTSDPILSDTENGMEPRPVHSD